MDEKSAHGKGGGVVESALNIDEAEIEVYKCRTPRFCFEQHYMMALQRHSSGISNLVLL